VLYDGKAIAFGPSQEVFARVRAGTPQAAPQAAVQANRPSRRAVTAESMSS
jgi:hypothetical protein